jgi:hypothetical protein
MRINTSASEAASALSHKRWENERAERREARIQRITADLEKIGITGTAMADILATIEDYAPAGEK